MLKMTIGLCACVCVFAVPGADGANDGLARLRVTEQQLACCYTEGSIGNLELRDNAGTVVIRKEGRGFGSIRPLLDERFPAGTYTLRTWQRDPGGNPDEPLNDCSETLELEAGTETFITSAFEPGVERSTLSRTVSAPPTEVPDAFAFRTPAESCGGYWTSGGPPIAGNVRACFAAANAAGTVAEFTVFEPDREPNAFRQVVYRTLTDRSIDVFAAPNITPTWDYYTCTGLTPDALQQFGLEGCGTPVVLEAAPVTVPRGRAPGPIGGPAR